MNSFGRIFRISIFGESHGAALGVVVDGVKAGIRLDKGDFEADILRRKSGAKGTTPRIEGDEPEILSGLYEGCTTGAPMAILFRNMNTRSGDYESLKDLPRPGHADYTASVKWNGFNDPRGGGHFSGRLTLPLVAAGVVAKTQTGFRYSAELVEIGGEACKERWDGLLSEVEGDSLGGIVECRIEGVPAGIGEPFFDSVESLLAHAMFAIPGVRGVEFGDGFQASRMKGSEHNDPFIKDGEAVKTSKNGSGGVNGGLTNGAPIVFRVAFKPTSSISKNQQTLNLKSGETVSLSVPGRHDKCFALRTPVVVEALSAIVLADILQIGEGLKR